MSFCLVFLPCYILSSGYGFHNNKENERIEKMTIDYNKFIHSKERAALRTIKQDPLIDTVLKKFMVVLDECMMKGGARSQLY